MDGISQLRVVALAGGVGGARLADGLAQVLFPANFTVIVNVGDDFEHFGLKICPDLDTVCYTLAGIANPETGWGRADEGWRTLETLEQLSAPTWFRLGDRDLGLHLERTRRLYLGDPLSQVTADFCRMLGVIPQVLPVTDDCVPTWVHTTEGVLSFQEYFVRRRCEPQVTGFHFAGATVAKAAPGVFAALEQADLVIFCPSNPWVSLDPILAIPGVRERVQQRLAVGVSPIIAGRTVKGPAAKMYRDQGIEPSAWAVAHHYQDLLAGFVLDLSDRDEVEPVETLGLAVHRTDIVMKSSLERKRLGKEVIEFGVALLNQRRGA